jgi:Fic family protein
MKLAAREEKILYALATTQEPLQSSAVHEMLQSKGEEVSLVTVKRALSELVARGLVETVGAGPATAYTCAVFGRLFVPVDAHAYTSVEPDKRPGRTGYNFDLFAQIPSALLSHDERTKLGEATQAFVEHARTLTPVLEKKELERLVIELSWKSSRIEGNTYTLLDAEKLIRENKEAVGHDHAEAVMILNHKDAFEYVRGNTSGFLTLTRTNLDTLHAILVKDLHVQTGVRQGLVGVTGSLYRPLDNVHQLCEALDLLVDTVARMETPYEKALVALLGVSYLQPFEDGNKRTARMMANAILLANGCAPLSYRSVEEHEYREAMLVFYELNSIVPFKRIFTEQYLFAAQNYALRV